MTADHVAKELRRLANSAKAKSMAGYFKTGPSEYGEGDIFIGLTVPEQRVVARKFQTLQLIEVAKLLKSPIHEFRLTALEILTMQYEDVGKASDKNMGVTTQKKIIAFYLKHTKYINNWDLVDTSASYVLGNWLLKNDRKILYKLVKSKNIWERRIAIISTHAFIRAGDFADTLRLAEILLTDTHDLMHKAVGWMLREVGKKSEKTLEIFLAKHIHDMPRTALRYAIEKFPESRRKAYLKMGK